MTDLVLDWESGAAARHAHLGIPLENLFAARDLVRGAMGAAWFEEQERRHDRVGISGEHALYRQLTAPNDLALVEIAELAHYLMAFANDPAIAEVIKDLRSDKFWAVFYELAMAYRWQDAGATVTLAPATAKGIADFKAVIDWQEFIVEVSKFEDDFVGSFRFDIPIKIVEAVEKALLDVQPFVCKIYLHEELAPGKETPLRAAAKEACHAFRQARRAGQDSASVTSDFCTVTLERLTNSSETNPFRLDEFGRQVSVREHEWNAYIGSPDDHARFFFQVQPEERSFHDELLAKVTKEVKQLARTETPTVVMIDVSAFGDFYSLPLASMQDALTDVLRQHQRVASLWFFSRQWTTAFRYKYWWTHLESPFAKALVPCEFLERLIDREWRWDFLGGREYEFSTPETDSRRYAEHMAIRR
ncbi:MAG: hypothetical protein JO197_15595 [Acidobacteria bacterium]|nr:hypothetical protein [Acidobacteriota bacterium]MBV9475053.1 hypothetical protein [Acidobacteriota bacterium]